VFGTIEAQGHRACLYGGGGSGKTTLACNAPGPVAVFDLELSMPVLRPQLPPDADIRVVAGIATWKALRSALHSDGWESVKTIVIDSATEAEELALAHVLATIPVDDKRKAERIEDYPYGKGYTHMYETFLTLLGDLDQHVRAGRNVILIAHDCATNVPNPSGEDWLRYEPRLQSPPSGKNSIRLRVREWADHVLFLGFDLAMSATARCGTASSTGRCTPWSSPTAWPRAARAIPLWPWPRTIRPSGRASSGNCRRRREEPCLPIAKDCSMRTPWPWVWARRGRISSCRW